MKKVGLLVGRERTFPDALITEVNGRNAGVTAEYAKFEAVRIHEPPAYDVLIDRISHDVTCFQPILKLAQLNGTRIINDPFWRIADDKYFDAGLALKLGVAVPKTVLLPSQEYGPDVSAESLRNLQLVNWEKLVDEIGLPAYMKPHWGGGWKDVTRVKTVGELFAAYHRSGRLTMMLQQEIKWQQYARCIVVGREHVRVALWDPRLGHFERYVKAAESMPALSPELENRIVADALKLCRALGYDMNTVEFAVSDGVPYAIDFMNSAPDLDITSLGADHFRWVVEKMGDLVVQTALDPTPRGRFDFSKLGR